MNQKPKTQNFIPIIVSIVIILAGIGISYGIVYSHVSNKIKEAQELAKEEKYNEAIELLEFYQHMWLIQNLGIEKQAIANEIEKDKKLLEDKTEYTQGIEEFNNGNWEQAKELLSKVSENSPYYQDAKNKIEEAQKKIIEKQIAELQQKVKELEKKQLESSSGLQYSVSSIVEYWKPRMAYIICDFGDVGKKGGSGTVLIEKNSAIYILTNLHILAYEGVYDTYLHPPDYCIVKIENEIYTIPSEKITINTKGYDFGFLIISNPSERLIEIANSWKNKDFCPAKFGKIGDNIVVLGYPAIGSPSGLTATEGIISGFEDYYYITSAKIDAGNSGGAAILLKGNCFLGIPTYIVKGRAESLGRILDFIQVFLPHD
jgi:S1-C subfamily serine protease